MIFQVRQKGNYYQFRVKLVKKAWGWDWSSAREHILKEERGILFLTDVNKYMEIDDWRSCLSEKEDKERINEIRKSTLTGKLLGNKTFVTKLQKFFGRRPKALPGGRSNKK